MINLAFVRRNRRAAFQGLPNLAFAIALAGVGLVTTMTPSSAESLKDRAMSARGIDWLLCG